MNLRWSILHFSFILCKFVGIWTRIARPLFTVCTGFHTNLHYPFIFHSQFSILHNEKSLSFPRGIFLYLLGVS